MFSQSPKVNWILIWDKKGKKIKIFFKWTKLIDKKRTSKHWLLWTKFLWKTNWTKLAKRNVSATCTCLGIHPIVGNQLRPMIVQLLQKFQGQYFAVGTQVLLTHRIFASSRVLIFFFFLRMCYRMCKLGKPLVRTLITQIAWGWFKPWTW